MQERVQSILGHTICGIVVAERTVGDMPLELHLCFTDGTTFELHYAPPQWGYHSWNRLPMVVDRLSGTSRLTVYGDGAVDRPPRPRRRLSRGIAFRVPILQILRERGGKARPKDVLVELEQRMHHDPSLIDRARLPSGAVRWEQRAVSEVRLMRKERLLYPPWVVGRGVWMLAPDGSKIAERLHAHYKAIMEGAANR